jgi:hypothetical protein
MVVEHLKVSHVVLKVEMITADFIRNKLTYVFEHKLEDVGYVDI